MKWLKFAAIALVVILLFSTKYIYQSRLPESGKINLPGLSATVDVYQDEYGIPHIHAHTYQDAYKVLGYVFASQRLFQMEMLKRIVRGSLSELFGSEFVEADSMLRTFGFYRRAKQSLELNRAQTTPEALEQVQSFLEGVNHYVKHGPRPIEFLLLGRAPTEFEMADVAGVGGYMALTFAEGMLSDLSFLAFKDQLSPELLETLKSRDQIDWKLFKEKVALPAAQSVLKTVQSIQKVAPLFYGSNSWVLSGKRTQSGKPILANDPHIAYSNPAVFIEAHLMVKDFEVYGHFIPLVPFSVLGHTPEAGWAITMSETDDLDFYIEKINPENPDQVMFNNEWVTLKRIKEVIKVKGEKDVEIEVLETPHGPLIDKTKYAVPGYNLAMKWQALELENNNFETFYRLPRVTNPQELKKALSYSTSPGLNISWVHANGDIAWWVMNRIPRRPMGFIADMPMPGWNGKFEYEGYLSMDENPHQINPDDGVIVTANYKPQLKQFAHIPGYWQPAGRYFRIVQLLQQKQKWSVEELKAIQLDSVVPAESSFNPLFLEALDESKLSPLQVKALSKLKQWNGQSDMHNVASSIYHMLNGVLIQDIFKDELKERYEIFSKGSDFWMAMQSVMTDKSSPFWDNINTEAKEDYKQIIHLAFVKAVGQLESRLGSNVDGWQWGKLHMVEFAHAFGKKPPLDLFFNIGPYPADGGRYQINNIAFDKSGTDFSALHGPATRRLIDFALPRQGLGIIPTGNSGNVFDRNYDDQTPLYLQGQYRPQQMQWTEIRKMPQLIFYSR